jgi:hypothetical protein
MSGQSSQDTRHDVARQTGEKGNYIRTPLERIFEIKSSDRFTVAARELPILYFYYMLDFLPELSYAVSLDFFKRPHLFTDVGGFPYAAILARLRAKYGSHENIPSKAQRDEIFLPIFGSTRGYATDGASDFSRLRDELLKATAAFAERHYDTGVDMLRERVRTTHRPFKEFIAGLSGASLQWSSEVLPSLADQIVYPILRNKGIAAVFGISTAPRATWPYDQDPNGDKLVEEVSKQLGLPPTPVPPVTREQFSNLQRAARRGAEALAEIIDFNDTSREDPMDLLITKCYTWGSALSSIRY